MSQFVNVFRVHVLHNIELGPFRAGWHGHGFRHDYIERTRPLRRRVNTIGLPLPQNVPLDADTYLRHAEPENMQWLCGLCNLWQVLYWFGSPKKWEHTQQPYVLAKYKVRLPWMHTAAAQCVFNKYEAELVRIVRQSKPAEA